MEMVYLSLMLTGLSMVKFRKITSNDAVHIHMSSRRYVYMLEIEGGEWLTQTPSLTHWIIRRIKHGLDCRPLLSEVVNGKI